jgi:hypothetical protein
MAYIAQESNSAIVFASDGNDEYGYQYGQTDLLHEIDVSPVQSINFDYDQNGNLIKKVNELKTNLLANSDFETYTMSNGIADYWAPYGNQATYEVVHDIVSSGTNAQKFSLSSGYGGIYQDVAVTANTSYNLNGRVYITNLSGGSKVQIVVQFFDVAGAFLSDVRPVETSMTNWWMTLGATVTAPPGATEARIHLHFEGTAGTFIFDNVNFRKSDTPNMLNNWNFETYTGSNGIASDWAPYGNQAVHEVVHDIVSSGTNAQKISLSSGYGGVYQSVAVTANTSYDLNGRVYITNLSSGSKVQMVVQFYNVSGALLSDVRQVETSMTNSWVSLGATVTAPPGATEARIHLHFEGTTGTFIFDDVIFRKSE